MPYQETETSVKPKILVVGSINMDLVIKAERMPREGETLIGHDFQTIPGGKGANQAVAAARLGAETYMAGRVGADSFAEPLVSNLRREGIQVDSVLHDDRAATGAAMIIVDAAGNNSILVAPGANMQMTAADVDALDTLFGEIDCVLLQLEIPMAVVDHVLAKAAARGVTSLLDAGPAMKCPTETLRKATIVSPNETETEALTGRTVTDLDSARDAAGKLLDMGVQTVVLKLGVNGALFATAAGMEHVPSHRVDAVDTTAAGDAFTAALAIELIRGGDVAGAVRYANYAGALAVTRFGAQPSMPTEEEVRAFQTTGRASS